MSPETDAEAKLCVGCLDDVLVQLQQLISALLFICCVVQM